LVRESAAAIDPSGVLLAAVHHWANGAKLELTRSLREHSLLIAAVDVYCTVGRNSPGWLGASSQYADQLYSGLFFAMTGIAAVLFAVAYAIHVRLVMKPSDFVGILKRDLFGRFLTLRQLSIALPVLVVIPFFGATFTNLKILIPALQPFSWDATFAE